MFDIYDSRWEKINPVDTTHLTLDKTINSYYCCREITDREITTVTNLTIYVKAANESLHETPPSTPLTCQIKDYFSRRLMIQHEDKCID